MKKAAAVGGFVADPAFSTNREIEDFILRHSAPV